MIADALQRKPIPQKQRRNATQESQSKRQSEKNGSASRIVNRSLPFPASTSIPITRRTSFVSGSSTGALRGNKGPVFIRHRALHRRDSGFRRFENQSEGFYRLFPAERPMDHLHRGFPARRQCFHRAGPCCKDCGIRSPLRMPSFGCTDADKQDSFYRLPRKTEISPIRD